MYPLYYSIAIIPYFRTNYSIYSEKEVLNSKASQYLTIEKRMISVLISKQNGSIKFNDIWNLEHIQISVNDIITEIFYCFVRIFEDCTIKYYSFVYPPLEMHYLYVRTLDAIRKMTKKITFRPRNFQCNFISKFSEIYVHYQTFMIMSLFQFEKSDYIPDNIQCNHTIHYLIENFYYGKEKILQLDANERKYFSKTKCLIIYILTNQKTKLKELLKEKK